MESNRMDDSQNTHQSTQFSIYMNPYPPNVRKFWPSTIDLIDWGLKCVLPSDPEPMYKFYENNITRTMHTLIDNANNLHNQFRLLGTLYKEQYVQTRKCVVLFQCISKTLTILFNDVHQLRINNKAKLLPFVKSIIVVLVGQEQRYQTMLRDQLLQSAIMISLWRGDVQLLESSIRAKSIEIRQICYSLMQKPKGPNRVSNIFSLPKSKQNFRESLSSSSKKEIVSNRYQRQGQQMERQLDITFGGPPLKQIPFFGEKKQSRYTTQPKVSKMQKEQEDLQRAQLTVKIENQLRKMNETKLKNPLDWRLIRKSN